MVMKGKLDELQALVAYPEIAGIVNEQLDSLMAKISENFRAPLRLYATHPTPDAKLNIMSNQVLTADGTVQLLPPIDGEQGVFPVSSIDFQTGAVVGGTIYREGVAFTLPGGSTIGQYRRVVFSYNAFGNYVNCIFSAQAATIGALTPAKTLHDTLGDLYLGHTDIEATAAAAYKTAGSATAIIENKVGVDTRIFRAGSAGSGGGGGGTSKTFTLANNQVSAADVTGFLMNSTKHKAFNADILIKRRHSSPDLELNKVFTLKGFYNESTGVWHIGDSSYIGDETGLEFTMTNSGQMQYTSTNVPGTIVSSYIKFMIRGL